MFLHAGRVIANVQKGQSQNCPQRTPCLEVAPVGAPRTSVDTAHYQRTTMVSQLCSCTCYKLLVLTQVPEMLLRGLQWPLQMRLILASYDD